MKKLNWNIKDNEARIILTNSCNYKCVFCHNEGFDPYKGSNWKPTEEKVIKILDEILNKDCTDITLTGGEPLMYKDIVFSSIKHIYNKNPKAEVTVVTNASLLTEDWIQKVSLYKSSIRFNISLHTPNEKSYHNVTAQKKYSLEDIKSKIKLLKKYDISFKLNCVAMKEYMTKEEILNLVGFSKEVGAKSLKLLELLIMEQQESMFSSFIKIDTIKKRLPSNFEFNNKHSRRDEYYSSEDDLTIELQKCRCRSGCNKCLINTTSCFNANGDFFPCFEFNQKSYNLSNYSMNEALDKGMIEIKKLAEKYGEDSPSLIKDVQYTDRRKKVYFEFGNKSNIKSILDKSIKKQKREYNDYYFDRPEKPKEQTVKMRVHQTDEENAKLILSTTEFDTVAGYSYTSRIFQRGKETMVEHPDFIINTMKFLGWSIKNKLRILEEHYEYGEQKFILFIINNSVNLINISIKTDDNLSLLDEFNKSEGVKIIDKLIDEYYEGL